MNSSSINRGREESTNRKTQMINTHYENSDSAIITFMDPFKIDYLKCIVTVVYDSSVRVTPLKITSILIVLRV